MIHYSLTHIHNINYGKVVKNILLIKVIYLLIYVHHQVINVVTTNSYTYEFILNFIDL